MQFLTDQGAVDEMLASDLPKDCYAYDREYPHHYYLHGEKVLVVRALYSAIKEAQARKDEVAISHLMLHDEQVRGWAADMERQKQGLPPAAGHEHYRRMQQLPDDWDSDEHKPPAPPSFVPPIPFTIQDLGIQRSFVEDMVIRTLYYKGNITGGEIATTLRVPFYGLLSVVLEQLRSQELIDICGQIGLGDAAYQFTLTVKGQQRAQDALDKTGYNGPMPVSYNDLLASIRAQTIKNLVVTRKSIRQAFQDLIISDSMFNLIGPAVNSASSIFFFGAAGNGKTSIAERITRMMGDTIFVPYAVETDGQIIKLYDPINHVPVDDDDMQKLDYDARWVRIKRPVVVVGGELTMASLDLIYNENAKTYEAPFQMKANGGIFMIDDFGRQLMRPMELLNRWIVPLEKRYDYLTLITGKKLEVPFDQLIVFSTNLDPGDLADEAFLRRIKYKINVIDPSEEQFRNIFRLVCKGKKVTYEDRGVDYLLTRWYRPFKRPLRSCQPRDILEQMIAMAKYTMEPCTMSPDLIDAACMSYFVNLKEPQDESSRARPKFS
ncbi:MAG TPA: ATP-binding protein [Chloroflexia bacterium]|nr:ATP-binding protein [Chloroflexia bacterium]